jgi:anthranilate/para-aminobenzoate synthase component II
MTCGRYHSLRAVRAALPASLRVAASTEDGAVMAVEHRTLPRFGVQFHPESILTPRGSELLARFLELAGVPLLADATAAAPVVRRRSGSMGAAS